MKAHIESVHEGKSVSNVIFVTIVVLTSKSSKDTLNQFMKKKSHSNVPFVTTVVPSRLA